MEKPIIIDSHHHWLPANMLEDIPKYLKPGERVVKEGEDVRIVRGDIDLMTLNLRFSNIQLKLKEMDAAGVDVAVLSTACWQQWNNMEMAPKINEAMAELQAKYPHRIVGLAHVPPFGEGAVGELERAVRDLGLKGAALTTNFAGKYPDDDAYRPFFKKAEELTIPIFFHAAIHPVECGILERYGVTRTVGRLLDHTLATVATLYKVAKDFPKLKFLHGHLGGTFFIVKARLLDKRYRREDQPYEEMINRQLFFDTAPAWWNYHDLECAAYNLGCDHILLGSDYPVKSRFLIDSVETIRKVRVSEEDRRRMLGENAAKLFKL